MKQGSKMFINLAALYFEKWDLIKRNITAYGNHEYYISGERLAYTIY